MEPILTLGPAPCYTNFRPLCGSTVRTSLRRENTRYQNTPARLVLTAVVTMMAVTVKTAVTFLLFMRSSATLSPGSSFFQTIEAGAVQNWLKPQWQLSNSNISFDCLTSTPAPPTHASLTASASRFVMTGRTASIVVSFVRSCESTNGEETMHHAAMTHPRSCDS